MDKFGLKKLDLYIIKKFLGTFFFSIALIMSIVIVFDLAEKIDDFLEQNVPLSEIVFVYYFNFLPYFANFFSPLFIFISVIFFTSKLTSNSEIIAILSNGISYHRLMFPYFLSALFLGILSFFLTGYIIPEANKKRIDFEYKYIDSEFRFTSTNIHRQILPGTFVYIKSYDNNRNAGSDFTIEKFEDKELISKLVANRVSWDSITQKWSLKDYYIRNYSKINRELEAGKSIDTSLNLYPKDFQIRLKSIEKLTSTELSVVIKELTLKGDDNLESYIVEKYRRVAFPFSTFILTLIGVSLSTKKRRGGTGVNIGLGLALSFIYILFMQVFGELAKANSIPSLLGVWMPNIIFFIIGIFLYIIAPK
ncbi:MAG: LptF/LptG family permease [Bacteroidales bacterium]|nr:LptF/LptG family permease [Bacteroidales bacterium]MBN2756589.1 LptF/LptG family permease [Bacteroidales bacterium]